MYSRWIEMEHYRLQCVREWPESPHRKATMQGILHSLKRLGCNCGGSRGVADCPICQSAGKLALVPGTGNAVNARQGWDISAA